MDHFCNEVSAANDEKHRKSWFILSMRLIHWLSSKMLELADGDEDAQNNRFLIWRLGEPCAVSFAS
jgi:hypothetical protein